MLRRSIGVVALMLATNTLAADHWEYVGPNVGPVLSIAVDVADPDRLYAVTGTGVHHTADGGRTWGVRLEDFEPFVIEAYLVVTDPSTSGTAYVAAGCFDPAATGCGVHVTHDGGNTWDLRGRSDLPAPLGGPLLAVSIRGTTLYASVRNDSGGGLFASEDDGETWAERSPLGTSFLFSALAADPFEEMILLAGINGDDDRGLALSGDGGRTWSVGMSGDPRGFVNAVAYDPIRRGVAYAGFRRDVGFGGLYQSSDGGHSWKEVDSSLAATSVEDIVVDPADSRRLYLATNDGVSFSDAGGACPRPLRSGLAPGAVEDLAIDATGEHLYAATTAGVFRIRPPASPIALSSAARACRSAVGRTARRLARRGAAIGCVDHGTAPTMAHRRGIERRHIARVVRACRAVTPADLGFPEVASLAEWVEGVVGAYTKGYEDLLGACPDGEPTEVAARAAAGRDLGEAYRALSWCLGADMPASDLMPGVRSTACAARLNRRVAAIPTALVATGALVWDACERAAALEIGS